VVGERAPLGSGLLTVLMERKSFRSLLRQLFRAGEGDSKPFSESAGEKRRGLSFSRDARMKALYEGSEGRFGSSHAFKKGRSRPHFTSKRDQEATRRTAVSTGRGRDAGGMSAEARHVAGFLGEKASQKKGPNEKAFCAKRLKKGGEPKLIRREEHAAIGKSSVVKKDILPLIHILQW